MDWGGQSNDLELSFFRRATSATPTRVNHCLSTVGKVNNFGECKVMLLIYPGSGPRFHLPPNLKNYHVFLPILLKPNVPPILSLAQAPELPNQQLGNKGKLITCIYSDVDNDSICEKFTCVNCEDISDL